MNTAQRFGRTALDILVGVAVLGAAIALHRFALVPLVEGAFAWNEAAFTQVRRVSLTALFVVAYALGVRLSLRRWPTDLHVKPVVWALSGFAGAAMIAVPMIILWATGTYQITEVGAGAFFPLLSLALVVFAAALLEEIVFRGILFGAVERYFGTIVAIIVPSILFSVLHIFNDNWGGWLALASGVLLGVFWTLVYVVTRSIWAAALNHACWNLTIVLSGLPLTGAQDWRAMAPIQTEPTGPAWWSGGDAGPESTLLCVGVLVLGCIVLWRSVVRQGAVKASPETT
ncbi:MAG: type II CAAX endopeptidase family protein [Pseudomonadota bacterium]